MLPVNPLQLSRYFNGIFREAAFALSERTSGPRLEGVIFPPLHEKLTRKTYIMFGSYDEMGRIHVRAVKFIKMGKLLLLMLF